MQGRSSIYETHFLVLYENCDSFEYKKKRNIWLIPTTIPFYFNLIISSVSPPLSELEGRSIWSIDPCADTWASFIDVNVRLEHTIHQHSRSSANMGERWIDEMLLVLSFLAVQKIIRIWNVTAGYGAEIYVYTLYRHLKLSYIDNSIHQLWTNNFRLQSTTPVVIIVIVNSQFSFIVHNLNIPLKCTIKYRMCIHELHRSVVAKV